MFRTSKNGIWKQKWVSKQEQLRDEYVGEMTRGKGMGGREGGGENR